MRRQERLERMLERAHRQRAEWSIGIYVGDSPLHLTSPLGVANPVLTRKDISDVQADFVADPFILGVHHTWYMFFEIMNRQTGKGEIGLAISGNGVKWLYEQIVLAEPFHLSYPYVFEWKNEYYMIPESYQACAIRLYKALKFPIQWACVGTLLDNAVFLDSSVFRYGHKWWMFTETSPNRRCDTLRLYYADDLLGPWCEHPGSPIVEGDPRRARPAGRVLVVNGGVLRYAQDCYPTYGTRVRAFEITELTTTRYREREVDGSPILTASGDGWNGLGMHHIDPHQMDDGRYIACVDGWSRRGG